MSIKSIEITNFKSIEYLKLDISEINSFVGKNGVGKTTIMNAISYFYDNLIDIKESNTYFDTLNKYKNKIIITIEYDFSRIKKYSTDSYDKKLFSMLNTDVSTEQSFFVTLEQKKKEHIEWNIDYELRYIIFNSHPVYFCDTRNIRLTDWGELWSVVGDLVNAKDANEISNELLETLKTNEFQKFDKYSKLFRDFLVGNDLSIHKHSKKEKIISLLQLQLGGRKFISNDEQLEFYSDGTNSQNYILFLAYIAYEISNKRLKDVTVILDEPELGLHPKMIDELMEKLVEYSKNVNFIIFSHSARLISYVLRNGGDLYNLKLKDSYTEIRKINKISENNHKLIVSDREASLFFADFLLFVEGVSEVELFSNKMLVSLFPILKKVEIVNTNSNDHILKMLGPNKSNAAIPYLILIDLDKLIKFQFIDDKENKCKFKIIDLWYSPLVNKEIENKLKYNYGKLESQKYLNMKKKIVDSSKREYTVNGYFQSVENFSAAYKRINNFNNYNNVFAVRTTIEGTIINNKTNKYINRWRRNKHINETSYKNLAEMIKLDKTVSERMNKEKKILKNIILKDRVSFNRLRFSGKTEMLNNYSDIEIPDKYSKLMKNQIKKNSYWISDFLEYYDKTILGQQQYRGDKNNKKKKERFKKDFPELYAIINLVEQIMDDE